MPNKIPTTFEMDGLYTEEDIANRHRVMSRCHQCNEWTEQDTREKEKKPCVCGNTVYDQKTTFSLRTWNPNYGKKAKDKKVGDSNVSQGSNGPISWNDPRYIDAKFKKKDR